MIFWIKYFLYLDIILIRPTLGDTTCCPAHCNEFMSYPKTVFNTIGQVLCIISRYIQPLVYKRTSTPHGISILIFFCLFSGSVEFVYLSLGLFIYSRCSLSYTPINHVVDITIHQHLINTEEEQEFCDDLT